MALEDYLETEVGVAAAVTAIALSPRVRNTVRRGAVLGLAGAMKAADTVTSTAKHVAQRPHEEAASGNGGATPAAPAARRPKAAAS
jgi:hypothetical protein